MKVFSSFTDAYYDLIKDVYEDPEFTSAPRGQNIREKLGVTFRITNPLERLPYIPQREFSITYYIAESLWYLSGNDSTEWISNYSSFWKRISDDGTTANSAYGSRIFKPHDRIAKNLSATWTQWQYVIDELCNDPDSRRAVIHIRSPHDSLLAQKDVPCTLSLQFFLRNDNLHMSVSMRSSDLILGIAYDVPAFTLFQEILAKDLSSKLGKPIGLGTYTHTSNSLHIYEKHYSMAESIIKAGRPQQRLELPALPSGDLPIDKLVSFEEKCQSARNVDQLMTMLDDLSADQYWMDWCTILSMHRACKLEPNNLEVIQRKFMGRLNFKGYSFFAK